jgi:hypothetical protein
MIDLFSYVYVVSNILFGGKLIRHGVEIWLDQVAQHMTSTFNSFALTK